MADAAAPPPARTVTELLKEAADAFPSRRALSFGGEHELTHGDLDALVDDAAARLVRDFGVRPGDVVALSFPNTVELVFMFLAVIRARGVAELLNPAYTQEEFEIHLYESQAHHLFSDAEGIPAAQAAAANLFLDAEGIPAGAKLAGVTVTATFAGVTVTFAGVTFAGVNPGTSTHPDSSSVLLLASNNEASDNALFVHTCASPDASFPGLLLTQGDLAASVKSICDRYGLSGTDATVAVLPFFQLHGLLCALLAPLASGGAVTLPAAEGRFDASTFWADMRRARATWYVAEPAVHQIILDRHASNPEQEYPELRFVRSCGASLPPADLKKLEAAFGAPVLEAYAKNNKPKANEAAFRLPRFRIEEHISRGGEKKNFDELILEANVVLRGHRDVKDAASFTVPDGNGQKIVCVVIPREGTTLVEEEVLAHCRKHLWPSMVPNKVYITDELPKIKEHINRGGEMISRFEVDAVLLDYYPYVKQAVSFAVPDDTYGEEIVCAVIPREGEALSEEDVVAHCLTHLAPSKVPKKVYITDRLPKTAAGNIARCFFV